MTSEADPIRENEPAPDAGKQSNARANHRSCRTEKDWWDKVKPYAEIVGILLLALYTFYTIKMYHASKMSADAAASAADTATKALAKSIDDFRIDERAWIEIEQVKPDFLGNFPQIARRSQCGIYPRNVGKTVATDITVKASAQWSSEELDADRSGMANIQDRFLLDKFTEMGTGNTVNVPKNPVPKVLAPNTTSPAPFRLACQAPQFFSNGHQMIHYILGRIDYCDQFRVKHWHKFCYFVVNARGEIRNCQEGNDEDRNPETTLDSSCTT